MAYKVIHNALVNKVQTQAIYNCRITARAVIWSTSYFPNVSIFLLTALGGLQENPGIFGIDPSWNETVSITQIVLRLLEFTQMFLIVSKFKWSALIQFNPNLNKAVPLSQLWMKLLSFVESWFSLLEFTQIFSNLWKYFDFVRNRMKLF